MSFARSYLPALTTSSLPPNVSSSSSSSPLTPFSELGVDSSILTNSLTTPTTSPDVFKPSKNYVTYPEPSVPPRQLTPPPKSRFVPLFESISKASNSPTISSRRGSLGDDEASPSAASISLPFSPAVTKQMRKSLSLTSNYLSIEPALKSAPLTTSSLGNSPWAHHLALPSFADGSRDHLSHAEQLNDVIRGLRHQLNITGHRLQTAETEIARLSDAYASVVEENARIVENYARAKNRIEELETMAFSEERNQFRRDTIEHHRKTSSQSRHPIVRESKAPTWAVDNRKRSVGSFDFNASAELVATEDNDPNPPAEPVTEETYQSVITRIPEMPTEVIIASLADIFLSSDFNFLQWLASNGLMLPESAKKLDGMSWEDRLRLDAADLDRLGVNDPADRSYVMRVLKAIAEGEAPQLHPSFISGFTEDQYVAIMREQRIDKHVPNLSGIPWPLRLFLDEEDLVALQVQKAGARGTIMTVFSGLRKGCPRPEPRPRRGTKKSKRAKQEATTTASGADDSHAEKQVYGKGAMDKRSSNIKIAMGRQGPRMAPRDKGAFAPVHSHHLSGGSQPSWYGNRV